MSEEFPLEEDPKCAECKLAIEEGAVVAFGNHIWHVECFHCAKCCTLVDHDSNLLLLSNGKPICENCSYNCRVCDKKIDDLAIMTGDDSYHSECFRCRLCQRKIEDLVFAKTSQGIYCIACHNGRMSKNKKPKSNSMAASKAAPILAKDTKDKSLPSVPTRQRPPAHTIKSHDSEAPALILGHLPGTDDSLNLTPPSTEMPFPSPSRRPPVPPGPPSSNSNPKAIGSPASQLDNFSFNLGRSPQENTTTSITDNALSSRNGGQMRSIIDENAYQKEESFTSTNNPENSQSVRARRRPTDAELRLPESQKDTRPVASAPATTDDPSYSLFPIKSPARTKTPAQNPTYAQATPRVQNMIEAERSMSSSPSFPSLPPTPNPDQTTVVPDRILNVPLPLQAGSPRIPSDQKTPTKSSRTPVVPPRSVDRQTLNKTTISRDVTGLDSAISQQEVSIHSVTQSVSTPPQTGSLPTGFNDGTRYNATSGYSLYEDPVNDGDKFRARQTSQADQSEGDLPDAPSTPKMTQTRRRSSQESEKTRGRHSSKKSLESSLQSNEHGLGSPVTTFENDLSKAFNLSPRPQTSLPGNMASPGLERSGTISRMANKMMKHRKSVSGSALSPRSPGYSRRGSVPDTSLDIAALQEELKLKNERISVLEQSVRQEADSKSVERRLEVRKSQLAAIETQIVESGAEHQSFLHHRHSASDTKVPLGTWKAKVVSEMDQTIRKTKNDLAAEIATLIRERNDLQLENESLQLQKAAHIQDLAILEKKHMTLSSMNESMLKQIQNGMEANKMYKPASRGRSDLSAPSPQPSPSVEPSEPDLKAPSDTLDKDAIYTLSNSTSRDLQNDIEEEIVVGSAIKRLSGDLTQDVTVPKKLNLVKKTKRAFRWGRNGSNSGQDNAYLANGLPVTERTMSSSKSSDKLSTKSGGGGMFKRTWQSQQNLSSHLEGNSRQDSISQSSSALFGNDLSSQLEVEGRQVPLIVTSCISIIESRALKFEGLYRKSGGAGEMKNLIDAFEAANLDHSTVDFTNFQDISAITSVLKQYLRRLPIPLINFDAYEPFLGTSAIPNSAIRVRAVQDVLRDLPPAHYHTLKVLFKHLLQVSKHADVNLMTTKNLAVVLGPTVIWDQAGNKEISDMYDKNSCIQFCIEHADEW